MPNFLKKWINIKYIYTKIYNQKTGSMVNMLNKLDIKLEGKHHSGIDDSKNIAKMCIKILEKDNKFENICTKILEKDNKFENIYLNVNKK